MKKFTIEVSHASPAQLSTIGLELKIMSNGWAKHGPRIVINRQQKKFIIEVSHASGPQLTTIALDLKIMANGWEKFGPRIMINGQQVQAPSLRIQDTSTKLQAPSRKRHKLAMFI
jgi:dissimilatory sulfite reductase (desulfoviridin) alpha/beta subunit